MNKKKGVQLSKKESMAIKKVEYGYQKEGYVQQFSKLIRLNLNKIIN